MSTAKFEADGTLVFSGAATTFEDLSSGATATKQGSTLKPDFDETNIGLLFPQNDPAEIVYIVHQMSHSKLMNSSIYPHIHFNQTSSSVPVFKMDYRWYKLGAAPTGAFTTVSTTTAVFTYVSGTISQVYSWAAISAPSTETVSSIFECKLYRDDNVVTGDVLVKAFDIHYEKDTLGSRTEFVK